MKRIVSILCATLFAFNSHAYAALVKNDCSYTFTYDADEKEIVTIIVIGKGKDFSDENIIAIKEGKAGPDGISFRFDIEEDTAFEGDYIFYVLNNSNDTRTEFEFTHASDKSIQNAKEWLDEVSDADSLYQMLEENGEYRTAFKAMGMNLEFYDGLSDGDKENVAEMFVDEKASGQDFSKVMNKCIGTVAINVDYKTEEALSCFSPFFEETAFEDIKDGKLVNWIIGLIGGEYESTDEVEVRYNELCILYKFKTAKFSEFYPLFEKYGESLGMSNTSVYKDYMKLSDSQISKVGDELIDIQSSSPAKTSAELLDNLKEASKAKKDTGGSSSGKTGGAGGGGSTGSGGYVPAAGTGSTPEKTNDDKEEYSKYNDIAGVSWAKSAIEGLTKQGIISGDGNGNFRPNDNITREEFAKLLVSAIGILDQNAECDLEDVDKNAWYYRYIASAFEAGIVKGISDSEFGISRNITRQEMAAMTARAVRMYKEVAFSRDSIAFEDGESIAEYAKEDVNLLYRMGIVSGDDSGYFMPDSTATRAQAAVVVYNLVS